MTNPTIAAIVQARMGSTRLPGKVMKEVLGKPLLGYLIDRLKHSLFINKIIIATTNLSQDDIIVRYAERRGVEVFRGSEDDVLDRYAKAAESYDVSTIVRITSDCPLMDSSIIDRGLKIFDENGYDYVSNTLKRTYPRGMDVEIFSRAALDLAAKQAKEKEEREHVTPYIIQHKELFNLKNFTYSKDHSNYRWTVDTKEDFDLISKLIEMAYPSHSEFTLEDLLLLNSEHPELRLINAHIEQKKL